MMIYGILHLEPNESSAHNVKISNFQDQIEIYLKNAANLSESLSIRGIDYTILTNKREMLNSISRKFGRDLNITEIPCITNVPSGFKFYSAHFKIDALKYISTSCDDYSILCDLDVICLNEVPQSLKNIISNKIPLFYDISDQVIAAYGSKVIIDDLSQISGANSQGRWAGGEFLSGPPAFFADLYNTIQAIWPIYISHSENLHHIGDEAVVSAALEIMVDRGGRICDAGTLGIIGRFWSRNIKHYQRSLMHYKDNFLLHLPADKRYLSKFPSQDIPNFFDRYKSHVRKKTLYNVSTNYAMKLGRMIKVNS